MNKRKIKFIDDRPLKRRKYVKFVGFDKDPSADNQEEIIKEATIEEFVYVKDLENKKMDKALEIDNLTIVVQDKKEILENIQVKETILTAYSDEYLEKLKNKRQELIKIINYGDCDVTKSVKERQERASLAKKELEKINKILNKD